MLCCKSPASPSSPHLWNCAVAPSLPELSLPGAVGKDAVSSETEDSDGALKPGPPSNLLYPEKKTALERKEQNPEAKWWRGTGMRSEFMAKRQKLPSVLAEAKWNQMIASSSKQNKGPLDTYQNFIKNLKFITFYGLMETFLPATGH